VLSKEQNLKTEIKVHVWHLSFAALTWKWMNSSLSYTQSFKYKKNVPNFLLYILNKIFFCHKNSPNVFGFIFQFHSGVSLGKFKCTVCDNSSCCEIQPSFLITNTESGGTFTLFESFLWYCYRVIFLTKSMNTKRVKTEADIYFSEYISSRHV